jgi:hypothetical protein
LAQESAESWASLTTWPQGGTKWPQSGTKWPQSGTKWPQSGTKWPQSGPMWPQSGPMWPQSGTLRKPASVQSITPHPHESRVGGGKEPRPLFSAPSAAGPLSAKALVPVR